MNNSAACRMVGVNRKTGNRWFYGRTTTDRAARQRTYAPITRAVTTVSARYLHQDERVAVADGYAAGESIRSIARRLDRDPSTISREISRNRDPDSGAYRPFAAQKRAAERRARPKTGKVAGHEELREFVRDRLVLRWSPEQISNVLSMEFADRPDMQAATETIYQAIYQTHRGDLRRELSPSLRSGRTGRRPRRRPDQRSHRFVDPAEMVDQRPFDAVDRIIAGHWEGDLIMGSHNRSAIGTLVERTTRYVLLLHLPNGHGAVEVRDALIAALVGLPAHLKRSLTWDQGVEMSNHKGFTTATRIPVFFCERAKPWQRGSNENTNGLLRQYFPKGTDLAVHSAQHLATVTAELNGRPRKSLGWNTPENRLATLCQPAV
jgi:IS30 family transposase